MFGLIRHRPLLQRKFISINVGKLTANPSELVPKKPKLTKLTKGSSNQITSFNERGAQITITKYTEMELEDMIEEGRDPHTAWSAHLGPTSSGAWNPRGR